MTKLPLDFDKGAYRLSLFAYETGLMSVSIQIGQGESYSGHGVLLDKEEAGQIAAALLEWSESDD